MKKKTTIPAWFQHWAPPTLQYINPPKKDTFKEERISSHVSYDGDIIHETEDEIWRVELDYGGSYYESDRPDILIIKNKKIKSDNKLYTKQLKQYEKQKAEIEKQIEEWDLYKKLWDEQQLKNAFAANKREFTRLKKLIEQGKKNVENNTKKLERLKKKVGDDSL